MATKSFVKQVAQKNKNGQLINNTSIGVDFDSVVDIRSGKGNYSLAQLFDNYIDFMQNATFVYSGPTQPKNTHVGIWLDTSSKNY